MDNATLPMKATSNGMFQGDNPLHFALPLLILQICIVLLLSRTLAFLLRPLRQPRVIAEIVGGILLGPTALGRNEKFLNTIFPKSSLTVLDTIANLGLLFFLFLVGLELDPVALRRTGKKAMSIAVAGISLPFVLGIGTSFVLRVTISQGVDNAPFLVFMGVALSITAFPVLARILAELKLLTTDLGKIAMSAAAVNDVAAWILLALAISLSGKHSPLMSLWVLLCGVGFVLAVLFLMPTVFKWVVQRCPADEPVKEIYICITLAGVLAAGFVTDMIGIHALFGAFMIGVVIPKEGPFAGALVEKVEDLVSGLFMPLFFVSSGLKTDITTIRGLHSWGLLVLVITTSCFGKIVGTVVVALFTKMPLHEALALGFLMNTKGLVELIVLNIGKERKVLNDQTFAIMVLMAVFTTFMATPLVMAVYKPAKTANKGIYKHRTIARKDPNSQLLVLACFHSYRNIPTLINLMEASRGIGKKEGLLVYAMHLMELSERSSAIRMVHKARKNGLPFWNKRGDNGQVIVAFETFRQLSQVSVRPMTAISSMTNIHEDICNSAESKRAAIIILPFHKHQSLDGELVTTRSDFRFVNQKVLENAPCSVGILIDRGLGGSSQISASNVCSKIAVLFFGGPDDREALAYGGRMAEHPGIFLTVIRFLSSPAEETVSVEIESEEDSSTGDEALLAAFREKTRNVDSINYEEKVVRNGSESIKLIKEISACNLLIVGRTPVGTNLPPVMKNDSAELGPVGCFLVSLEFSTSASVLVVQQYTNATPINNDYSEEDLEAEEGN